MKRSCVNLDGGKETGRTDTINEFLALGVGNATLMRPVASKLVCPLCAC